jgi:hypothetical protein
VILTACAIYPGMTSLWQGLHPLVTGMPFNLVGQEGLFMDVAGRLNLPVWVPLGYKSLIGLAWLAGVPGLWAGDMRAYPLTLLGAAGSLLLPGGPMVMAVIGLICLLGFREKASEVPA